MESRVAPSTPQAEVRCSTRKTKALKRYSLVLHYLLLTDSDEPECYDEALYVEAEAEWKLSIDDEKVFLMKNQT